MPTNPHPSLLPALLTLAALTSSAPAQSAPATAPASLRDRLLAAAQTSQALANKETTLPADTTSRYMQAIVPEDRAVPAKRLFARVSDAHAYLAARPWIAAYSRGNVAPLPNPWPSRADAPELRKLLADRDPVVRSLAVESLASLMLPEDPPNIAQLLNDTAPGAVVLGWAESVASIAIRFEKTDPDPNPVLEYRMWFPRTVQTYAREALLLQTGRRFDGQNPKDLTFQDWWKTHNLGTDSLWYWQQRLTAESRALPPQNPPPATEPIDPRSLTSLNHITDAAIKPHRENLHVQTLKDLAAAKPETQAKVFLLTHNTNTEVYLNHPMNPFFPEGFTLRISPARLLELAENKNPWPDAADVENARQLLLPRLAQVAPTFLQHPDLPPDFIPRVQTVLEKEAHRIFWMPPLVSRLLPPAKTPAEFEEPQTREGYLRRAYASTRDGAAYEIVQEMVRSNLEGQWPVLQKLFYKTDPADPNDYRQAILQALGEAPHTTPKIKALADWLRDPRNETILTQRYTRMGMDMYRKYAIWSLNAIAGKDYVPTDVENTLDYPEKSQQSLQELRRLADALIPK